jgi:hypothetical protein
VEGDVVLRRMFTAALLALLAATSASHRVDVIAPGERVNTAIDRLYKPRQAPAASVRPPGPVRPLERPATGDKRPPQPKANFAPAFVSRH